MHLTNTNQDPVPDAGRRDTKNGQADRHEPSAWHLPLAAIHSNSASPSMSSDTQHTTQHIQLTTQNKPLCPMLGRHKQFDRPTDTSHDRHHLTHKPLSRLPMPRPAQRGRPWLGQLPNMRVYEQHTAQETDQVHGPHALQAQHQQPTPV